jgi:integrase
MGSQSDSLEAAGVNRGRRSLAQPRRADLGCSKARRNSPLGGAGLGHEIRCGRRQAAIGHRRYPSLRYARGNPRFRGSRPQDLYESCARRQTAAQRKETPRLPDRQPGRAPRSVRRRQRHACLHARYTGIRWGEAIGLRLSSLDTLRRRMLIQESAVYVNSHVEVGSPKTHENRSVSYPKFLSEPLARQCEGKSRDQPVFGDGTTRTPRTQSWNGWFVRAVRKCQERDDTFPAITPHDLRHTAAILAISAGANPKAVQRMLGHASAALTLDTYADLFEDDLDAVSERRDVVRNGSVEGFSWGIEA